MSDAPLQADGPFESDAVDQFVQRTWDLFAALEISHNSERERRFETQDFSAIDDDGQEWSA